MIRVEIDDRAVRLAFAVLGRFQSTFGFSAGRSAAHGALFRARLMETGRSWRPEDLGAVAEMLGNA